MDQGHIGSLPITIAFYILRMCRTVLAPVLWISIHPGPLCSGLVVAEIRVGYQLSLAPVSAALTLIFGRSTAGLIWHLWTRLKGFAAADAAWFFHERSPST